ncbi:hypothetical protein [Flavobacterium sp.]|uniref:hypothetical protein n=1 Tax=Flavobacterium sp. TaxID=239 RepID=UPI002610B6A2|nr:hypothetical protein [Flavobacterium sp.]
MANSQGDPPTSNYVYKGNKLVKRFQSGSDSEVINTYTGNLMVSTKFITTDDGVLHQQELYEYDNQRRVIVSRLYVHMNWEDRVIKTIYTYNPDNTVLCQRFTGNSVSQTTPGSRGKIWLNINGQVLKSEDYVNGGLSSRVVNTYDDKNSAFKNAVGFDKLYGGENTMTHNLLTSTTTYWSNEIVSQVDGFSNTFTYNEEGYPITRESLTIGASSPSFSQYFYE